MKGKRIILFTAILCFFFMLVVYSQKQVFAGTVNEVQTLNDTWLSDLTNGFLCTASDLIGSDPVALYLDSDETIGYWIKFSASNEEGLISFDLTSITLGKYDGFDSLSFTVSATKEDGSSETSSFVWEADGTSSKDFSLYNMNGITDFTIEVTDDFDAYNLEYREFIIANPFSGNSPPIVMNLSPSYFLENTVNALPRQIDSDINVTDSDSLNFEGGQIIVSYAGTGLLEDQLQVSSIGNITISGSEIIYGPTGVIGTVSGGLNGSSLVIDLNDSANPNNVTELLRAITYQNTSDEPTSYRTVSIIVSDGDGGTSFDVTAEIAVEGEADSGIEFTQLVQYTNNEWLRDLNNGFAVSAPEGVTIYGHDDSIYVYEIPGSITISVAEQLEGHIFDLNSIDFILVNLFDSVFRMTITGYKGNGSTVTSSIVGTTQEEFSSIDLSSFTDIESFTFQTTLIDSSIMFENIRISSFAISNPREYVDNIAPEIAGLSDIQYMENSVNEAYSQISSTMTCFDVDSSDLDGGTITVYYQDAGLSEDQLWVGNMGNISVVGDIISHSTAGEIAYISGGNDGAPLSITLNSSSTPAYATEILRALVYKNISDEPTTYRTIIIAASDGDGGFAGLVSARITVIGQAESGVDIPSLTQNLYRDWNMDLNNGFSYSISKGIINGDSKMLWFTNNNLGTITFMSDEQFWGGKYDLCYIDFDMPVSPDNPFTITVVGHTNLDNTITSSIVGTTSEELNAIDLSNMIDLISFDIVVSYTDTLRYLGIESFTIANPVISNKAPLFTSSDIFSISETASVDGTILLDIDANNGDGGSSDEEIIYSITGGTASEFFIIDSSTGEINLNTTGASALDYETIDTHTLVICADDGKMINNISYQTITVVVEDEDDEPPVIASNGGGDTAVIYVDENTTAVTTVTAIDVDTVGDLTYSISGGIDAEALTITEEGDLIFKMAPDYETKQLYEVIIEVSDGERSDFQTLAIHINDVNEYTPEITSDGGEDRASLSIYENSYEVTTITAEDKDIYQILTFEILGGIDKDVFIIDATTGVLSFTTPPDYEKKTEHSVIVKVTDGTYYDTQSITVNIINIDEIAPVITSDGGGDIVNITINENDTYVTTVTATDKELVEELRYSIIGGNDYLEFQIDTLSGELNFKEAPDYERQINYEVIVQVSDGANIDTQTINITLDNLNDNPPDITSNGGGADSRINVYVNTRFVTVVTTDDADMLEPIVFSITGDDASELQIDAHTGRLEFKKPTFFKDKNSYEIIIIASDGIHNTAQTLHIYVVSADIPPQNEVDDTFNMVMPQEQELILYSSVLDKARESGEDINIKINDEEGNVKYSWSFESDNLLASNKKFDNIDLSIEVSQIQDNKIIIDSLEENDDVKGFVVSFGHEGELPAQATVRIYVGNQEGVTPGERIYLYHYNKATGKLDTLPYSSKYIVDEDGYITITIVHCSDYIILYKDAKVVWITSLRKQISAYPRNESFYESDINEKISILVTLPSTLEKVKSMEDATSQPIIGAVTLTYESNNKKVATVDKYGVITLRGVGKADIITTITLYSGKIRRIITKINVKESYIKIIEKRVVLKVGDEHTYKATAYGLDVDDVKWTTTKKSIVVIDKKSGEATAKSRGTDYVVASIGDYKVKIKVTVK